MTAARCGGLLDALEGRRIRVSQLWLRNFISGTPNSASHSKLLSTPSERDPLSLSVKAILSKPKITKLQLGRNENTTANQFFGLFSCETNGGFVGNIVSIKETKYVVKEILWHGYRNRMN